jgi:hypothetical protein
LLSKYFQNLRLEDAILKMGLSLQKKIAPPIEDGALLNTLFITTSGEKAS